MVLLRSLQVLRKDIGLEIEDRIRITYSTSSEVVETIMSRFGDSLKSELLACSLDPGDTAGGTTYDLAGEEVTVRIEVARD